MIVCVEFLYNALDTVVIYGEDVCCNVLLKL